MSLDDLASMLVGARVLQAEDYGSRHRHDHQSGKLVRDTIELRRLVSIVQIEMGLSALERQEILTIVVSDISPALVCFQALAH
jgi:hypothetical protein